MCNHGVARNGQRLALLVIGLGLWGTGAPALRGQSAELVQKQPQINRCYVKKTQFRLPLNMDQQTRDHLSEIHVYCLNNATGKWVWAAKCAPNQTGFNFEAPGDGEFWFTLCMVDKLKHQVPDDPSQSEYRMAVVVDTTPPAVDAHFISNTKEGYIVEASARDANLDPQKTHFEYQTLNKDWRALEPMAPGSNRYCIPVQAAVSGMVKVCAGDLADNAVCSEFELPLKSARPFQATAVTGDSSKYVALAPNPAAADFPPLPPLPVGSLPPAYVRPFAGISNPGGTVGYAAMPSGPVQVQGPKLEGVISAVPVIPVEDVSDKVSSPNGAAIRPKEKAAGSTSMSPPRLNEVSSSTATPIGDRNDGILQRLNTGVPAESIPEISPTSATSNSADKQGSVVPAVASNNPPANPPSPSRPVIAQRKLINQKQLMLNYRLEQVGASGVGKVEIWITADQSQSWQKLSEDVERKSPATIELPGEGVYGITLVVSNGRGFGGTPPNSGDAPDTWVEVDMTRPTVELKEIRGGGTEDPGSLHITWNAHDRNLAPDAVDLYFAANREGPWSPIAKGLRSDGHYRWAPPINVGSQVYVRLVARDLAGNATVVETSQPFAIDDMSRPRGRLVGIAPVSGDLRLETTDR